MTGCATTKSKNTARRIVLQRCLCTVFACCLALELSLSAPLLVNVWHRGGHPTPELLQLHHELLGIDHHEAQQQDPLPAHGGPALVAGRWPNMPFVATVLLAVEALDPVGRLCPGDPLMPPEVPFKSGHLPAVLHPPPRPASAV